jgi:hypothetical protein
VDKQPFVFLAFLRKAMFLGIHPDIFHVVRKIVFIPYSMVYKFRLPDGLAFFFFPYPLHYVGFYSANHVFDYNVWIRSEQGMPMIRQYHQCRQPKRMKFINIFESILQFKTKAIIRKNRFSFSGYHSHKIGLVPPVPSFRYMRHSIFPFDGHIPTVEPPYVAALWFKPINQ